MPRVLLVDDSPSVRTVFASRLRDNGFEVEEAKDGATGAELALARPPDVVVTDLWMPGISGVQLCRLLRSEAPTRDVPVILVTGESDRRSRFWARCAGAAAYVAKTDIAGLMEALAALGPFTPREARSLPTELVRGTIQERLSSRLDAALFESTVAGEVRSLAQGDGEADVVFRGLVRLASEIAGYRWLALLGPGGRAFLHTHPEGQQVCEAEARTTLRIRSEEEVFTLLDDRALLGRPSEPLIESIPLGSTTASAIALGPSERGASIEDRQLMSIMASELRGPLRIVALVEDVRRLAMIDPLTGLWNRRAFTEAMEREILRAQRHGHALSVLLLDVDHFKKVNDTYGHESGDQVLKGVAAALQRIARRSDQVGRWGGEEFVLGLAHAAMAGARVAAERLRRAIAETEVTLPDGATVRVTASIGIAHVARGEALESVLARADQAMYNAKFRGRNCVETAP
jgi:two-component system, cell cycle response regulator